MNEYEMLMAMEFGVDGLNEARGYDTSEPEPCGHHCGSDCPRCGDGDDDSEWCGDDDSEWCDEDSE